MKTIQVNNNNKLKINTETKITPKHDHKYSKFNAYLSKISKNLNLSYMAMMK